MTLRCDGLGEFCGGNMLLWAMYSLSASAEDWLKGVNEWVQKRHGCCVFDG